LPTIVPKFTILVLFRDTTQQDHSGKLKLLLPYFVSDLLHQKVYQSSLKALIPMLVMEFLGLQYLLGLACLSFMPSLQLRQVSFIVLICKQFPQV